MRSKTRHESDRSLMKRLPGLAIATGVALAFSLNVQAQDCTIGNWSDSPVGLSSQNNTGTSAEGFSRYAGPCSLRVPVSSSPAYVVTPPGANETSYNARFYLNRSSSGSADIMVFAAQDSDQENIVQIHYNDPTPGDFTFHAFNGTGQQESITISGSEIPTAAWVSVEFGWEASDAGDNLVFNVSGVEESASLDTSGQSVAAGLLGNVVASTGTGTIYFDDFDSRRETRPGRLCRGLTAGPDSTRDQLNVGDALAIYADFASGGAVPAGGQPDFDENGSVNVGDALAVFRSFSSGNNDCADLR